MPKKPISKTKVPDQNLALIAIILGATSFIMSVFTGIPAIIVGVIALRRGAGNRLQAKLGILFGGLSAILTAFIVWLFGFHFFNAPVRQQALVPREDYKQLTAVIHDLNAYRHDHGAFPICQDSDTVKSCADWRRFVGKNTKLGNYQIIFINDATLVPTQRAGTVVYVTKSVCFFNTPTLPSYLREKDDPSAGPSDDNVSLVYFYAKGRACYSTNQHYGS